MHGKKEMINLAYYEALGNAQEYNDENEKYLKVSAEDVQRVATEIFRMENSSTLWYQSKGGVNA